MSKLEDLIVELCPDGVEYRKLGDLTNVLRGKRLTKKELLDDGNYPVFHGGLEPLGYYKEKNRDSHTVMIINVGASAGTVGFSDVDFWSSDGCYCLEHNESVESKYLYYLLVKYEPFLYSRVRHAGIPTLDAKVIENMDIPVPPLAIQEEIVRILDAFTALKAELKAELNAREKQYAYYRNELFNIDNSKSHPLSKYIIELYSDGVEYKSLKTCILKNIGGGTPSKSKEDYWNGNIPWASVKDMMKFDYVLEGTDDFITENGLNNSTSNLILKGNIIVATRINCGRMLIAGIDVAINQDLRGLVLKDCILPKFLVYFFSTLKIEGKGTTVKGISVEELEKIQIPVPPLAIQEEIVRILDAFTELKAEVKAEIKAREKQYEYYRNQLLTFKPKETSS